MHKEDRQAIEAHAKEVRQKLVAQLQARAHDAELRRLRAEADKNDADASHYYSARNAYLDATWTVAEAILPPDEFEELRQSWARAEGPSDPGQALTHRRQGVTMRIDTDTKVWIVSDPMGDGTGKDDILFETTLNGLERQFRGGLTCDENPVIFTDRGEAEAYAERRLEAWRRHREGMTAIEAREKEERDRYRAEIEALR